MQAHIFEAFDFFSIDVFCDVFVAYDFFISFGICSTPKISNYVLLSPFNYKTIHWIHIDLHSSRFIAYALSFILGKLFLE